MRTPLLIVLLLVIAPGLAEAQSSPVAQRVKIIAPLVEETTVAVACLDLSRVQVDAIINKIAELVPEARAEQARMRQDVSRLLDAFREAGGKELYVLISLADIPASQPPWVIAVPLARDAQIEPLSALLKSLGAKAVQRKGDVLVAGSEQALARLRSAKADVRPELASALESVGAYEVQILILPPKYAARVVREMMPTLPAEIGGGPSSVVTRGFLWAAGGVRLPPQMAIRMVVQSEDRPVAEALRSRLADVLRLAGQQAIVRQRVPKFEEVARLLTPAIEADRLVVTLDEQNGGIKGLLTAINLPLEEARQQARRTMSANNLKMIGLAMHNYLAAHDRFPPQASTSPDGKPLLSWRVHLLPFLGQEELYKQFHLDEPWDSAHNRTLVARMPDVYRSPASAAREPGSTIYLVPLGKETMFPGREGVRMADIRDGASNTIMAVEAADARAVVWTKPDDLPFTPEQPANGLGGPFPGGIHALFGDGSVQFLSWPQEAKNLRALFTRAGGEPVSR